MGILDRFGEPIELEDPEPADRHDATCVDGFLGEDHQGRPIVCLRCRPHLRDQLQRRRRNRSTTGASDA